MSFSDEAGQMGGVLLLYHHEPPYAATVMEHVGAFGRHSRFPVWEVNVAHGFPPVLADLFPQVVVLHYSLFGSGRYALTSEFLSWLRESNRSYRVAFFQDEHQYCRQRFAFIDDYRIDCVYTLVAPKYHDRVYGVHTRGPRLVYTLPGYVSDDLVRLAAQRALPDSDRRIDIGYRARPLPWYQGTGAQEKYQIGDLFLRRCRGLGLSLDIAMDEDARLYGSAWTDFLANSRAFLGVEAGVSIFDLTGEVEASFDRLLLEDPTVTFDEVSDHLLAPFEGNVPYRTVSPRHFEAAAFRVVQILFEGTYSGVLTPMEHYIPLKKDFSNFDEVMRLFRDRNVRRDMTDRAYADLIDSGRYSYRNFVRAFDADLESAGLSPGRRDGSSEREIGRLLRRGTMLRRVRTSGRPAYRRMIPQPIRIRLRAAYDRVRRWS